MGPTFPIWPGPITSFARAWASAQGSHYQQGITQTNTLINADLGYQNLKIRSEVIISHDITCEFGRYRYTGLYFRAASVGDMFQERIIIYSTKCQMFWYCRWHTSCRLWQREHWPRNKLCWMLKICRKLRAEQRIRLPQLHDYPSCWENYRICEVQHDQCKSLVLKEWIHLNPKKEPQSFLGIMSYLSKYWPATSEICEPLGRHQ